MKTKLTIGNQLMLSFAAILALGASIIGVSLWKVHSLNARFETAVSKTARNLQMGAELSEIKSEMFAAQRGMVLAIFMTDSSRAETLRAEFDEYAVRMKKTLDEIRPLISVPEGRRLLSVFENDLSSWLKDYQFVLQFCQAGHPEDAQQHAFAHIAPVYVDMSTAGNRFVEVYREVLEGDKRAAAQDYEETLWLCFLSLGALTVICALVFFIVRRMNVSLRQTAAELSKGAAQVAGAAVQVSSSSQSLARGASEQAASLEQTSASSEQISCMARKNTENTCSAAELVTQSQQRFVRANESLEHTVVAIGEINAQSGKVSKIVKLIDEIAFQTNILALNAAVEAARAGEAGMGFAVVADEVRNLAQRCAQAAKETADLIEESIAKSRDGQAKVDEVNTAIRKITEESVRIKMLVNEVNTGSQEQAVGMEQISRTITQMDQLTQATAASAEESASAAEELTTQSETLKELVARLTAMVGGDDTASNYHGNATRWASAASEEHWAQR